MPKTAAQHTTDIVKLERKASRERREYLQARQALELYEDLRDDVISAVRNSGLSFEDIHARCGPHPHTLEAWASRKTLQPRMSKMRSTLRIIGKDFGII